MTRSGKTTIEPDMFDNINESVVESVKSISTKIKGNINNVLVQKNSSDILVDIIIPGKSMGKILINSNLNEIIEKLGEDYTIKEHGTSEKGIYSREYTYSHLGYSFLIKASDYKQNICRMSAFPPAKVKTNYGIVLLESTLKDVIKIYGKPQIQATHTENEYSADYGNIKFCFSKDKSVEQFPFNKELHLEKRIIKIILDK